MLKAYIPEADLDGGGFQIQQLDLEKGYIYVQFESLKRGYIDDVEFLVRDDQVLVARTPMM